MFHLAPVGLPTKMNAHPSQHSVVERNVLLAINDIKEGAFTHKIVYNLSHPDTKALIQSLDSFFSHGLRNDDKCYWCFIKEFIPICEQKDLSRNWNAQKPRTISLAWLKDSLNKTTLYFQMLAFIACSPPQKLKWYHKNACILNNPLLKRITILVENLSEMEFKIETPFVFRTEDIPIALPTPQIHGHSVPSMESSEISVSLGARRSLQNFRGSYISTSFQPNTSVASFSELTRGSFLDSFIDDLPEVNLPAAAHEDFISTAKEQEYMLNEIVKTHRKRLNINEEDENLQKNEDKGFLNEGLNEVIVNGENTKMNNVEAVQANLLLDDDQHHHQPVDLFVEEEIKNMDAESPIKTNNPSLDYSEEVTVNDAITSEKSDGSLKSSSDIPHSTSDDLSDICEGVKVNGEILLDSGEIVHMAMDVFRENAERFQKLFQVYTGHSTGQPLLRYLLITDLYIYVLSSMGPPNSEKYRLDEMLLAAEQDSLSTSSSEYKPKYVTHLVVGLEEVDCVTMGVDSQVLCIHLKRRRVLNRDVQHEKRISVIETGSQLLGNVIAHSLRNAINAFNTNNRSNNKRSTVFTRSAQLAIVLKRFTKQELELPDVEILHHALIYWQENLINARSKRECDELEGYLYVRSVNQKSWVKRLGEWEQSYFILKGCMLYQFSDSTCKFAQRSLNIRECVEQVCDIDLKNDDKYVFELTLTDVSMGTLQFSCPTLDEMKKWIDAITLSLSTSSELVVPVACQLIITETSVLFAQEGANCIVDGFMRQLGMFHSGDIATIYVVRMDGHHVLIVRRKNDFCEWIFLRDELELDRLVETFAQKWHISVEDCNSDENFVKPHFNKIFKECVKMPEWWRRVGG